MNKRYGWLIASAILLIASVYLILKPTVIDHMFLNPQAVEEASASVQDVSAEQLQKNNKRIESLHKQNLKDNHTYKTAVNDEGYVYPVSSDPGIEYDASTVSAVGEIPRDAQIDHDYMVGEIYMPSVDMQVPILEGISNENLWFGAGTMKPGQAMGQGNYALAGHHMWDASQLFTPILNANVGDTIYITDKNTVYEYVADNVFEAAVSDGYLVNDSEMNENNDPMITLVTCLDVWGNGRLIVTGELVNSYPIDDAGDELVVMMK